MLENHTHSRRELLVIGRQNKERGKDIQGAHEGYQLGCHLSDALDATNDHQCHQGCHHQSGDPGGDAEFVVKAVRHGE